MLVRLMRRSLNASPKGNVRASNDELSYWIKKHLKQQFKTHANVLLTGY